MSELIKRAARAALAEAGLLPTARRLLARIEPDRRATAAMQRKRLTYFRSRMEALSGHSKKSTKEEKRFLFNCFQDVDQIVLIWPLITAFRKNGYEPWALISARGIDWMEDMLRLVGVTKVAYYEDVLPQGCHRKTQHFLQEIIAGRSALDLNYRDALVGKYALSTFMRQTRDGDPDWTDPETCRRFADLLSDVLNYTDGTAALVERIQPTAALIIDRGYSPQGQIFDLMMARNAPCVTWNSTHRNQSLMLKRYTSTNRNNHHSTLSKKSWDDIRAMPWTANHWEALLAEFEGAYGRGEWASAGGSQVGKVVIPRDRVVDELGLDPTRKTVFVFSHIFWDGTFFWGKDIFRNYEDWFRQTVRAACGNSKLNWVFKVHPANATKDLRDGCASEHSELKAIREVAADLPPHVKVIKADSAISTLSLFPVMDFCVTVRGTIGIEAACRGIPVITAGTGRYDRKGFTIDPDTPSHYLEQLAELPYLEPMTAAQLELARRFAYGIFLGRPLPLRSIRFGYLKDPKASIDIDIALPENTDPFEAPDITAVAKWIESGDEDFLAPRLFDV